MPQPKHFRLDCCTFSVFIFDLIQNKDVIKKTHSSFPLNIMNCQVVAPSGEIKNLTLGEFLDGIGAVSELAPLQHTYMLFLFRLQHGSPPSLVCMQRDMHNYEFDKACFGGFTLYSYEEFIELYQKDPIFYIKTGSLNMIVGEFSEYLMSNGSGPVHISNEARNKER